MHYSLREKRELIKFIAVLIYVCMASIYDLNEGRECVKVDGYRLYNYSAEKSPLL